MDVEKCFFLNVWLSWEIKFSLIVTFHKKKIQSHVMEDPCNEEKSKTIIQGKLQ
jgi:hypothetical protein